MVSDRPGYVPTQSSICRERMSIAGVISFGASISPGLEARCGCGRLPSPITTVPPFEVASKSSAENLLGIG